LPLRMTTVFKPDPFCPISLAFVNVTLAIMVRDGRRTR
jgi:hypothetical protein